MEIEPKSEVRAITTVDVVRTLEGVQPETKPLKEQVSTSGVTYGPERSKNPSHPEPLRAQVDMDSQRQQIRAVGLDVNIWT